MATNITIKRYKQSANEWEDMYPITTWGNIQNKPATYTPSSHTHDYLPLSGGTLSSTGADILTLKRTSSSGGAAILFYNNNQTNNKWQLAMESGNDYTFKYNTVEKLRLTPDAQLKLSGEIILENAKALNGKTTGGTTSNIANVNASNNLSVGSSNFGYIVSQNNILPSTAIAETGTLGTSDRPWNKIYGTTLYENSTSLSNKYLGLSGGTVTGNLIVTAPHRDTYYASNLCRHFYAGTPTQFVIKTRIKFLSGTHMPVIRIYGYAYGEQCPIELRIGFYIYDNTLGWAGVVSTGAWKPEVYLFKYTYNSVDYVAVGLKGSCYFCGFQVDCQIGASGSFGNNLSIDGWSTTHNGANTSQSIIPAVGTDKCVQVSYRTMKTDISGSAGSVAWTNVTGRPTNVSAFTNDSGYLTSHQSLAAYSTTAATFGMSATADRFTFDLNLKKITNTTARNSWDSQVYSNYSHKDNVYISFRPGQTDKYIMAGLDSNVTESASYNTIDYCWYVQASGSLSIFESGTNITVTGHTTYAAGDEFKIEYSNGQIRYYHNGTLCRTVNRAVGSALAFDSSFYNGGYLYAVEYGVLTDTSGKADKVSMTAGTYKRVTVNSQGLVTGGDNVDTDTNYYHTRVYSSGLKISTGTGVDDMYVPTASSSNAGLVPKANSGDPEDGTYVLTSSGGTVQWTAGKLTDNNTTYSAEKGITLSNGKFGHSNTAITAQTTQALYPIKIDAYGHITGYGTAVTSLPASDVYAWAKASTKPSYTASEVGAATSGHTHTTSLATDSGTATVTLAHNTTYKLTAGGTSVIFKTPTDSNTNYYHTRVYSSGLKISTGTGVSDMYVPNLSGTQKGVVAAPGEGDPNTGDCWVLTASGGSVAWQGGKLTDTNTWRPVGTGATDAAAGNHAHGNITNTGTITSTAVTSATGVLVYDSNNKIQRATAANARAIIGAGTSSLTLGSTSTTAAAGNHTHTTSIETGGTGTAFTLSYGTKYTLYAGGNSFVFQMPASDNTNTATAADGIFKGSNSGTEIKYEPYSSSTATNTWVNNSDNFGKFYLGTVNPYVYYYNPDNFNYARLNFNGDLYVRKIYCTDRNRYKVNVLTTTDLNAQNVSCYSLIKRLDYKNTLTINTPITIISNILEDPILGSYFENMRLIHIVFADYSLDYWDSSSQPINVDYTIDPGTNTYFNICTPYGLAYFKAFITNDAFKITPIDLPDKLYISTIDVYAMKRPFK